MFKINDRVKKTKQRLSPRGLCRESLILSTLMRFSDFIYEKAKHSLIGGLLSNYPISDELASKSNGYDMDSDDMTGSDFSDSDKSEAASAKDNADFVSIDDAGVGILSDNEADLQRASENVADSASDATEKIGFTDLSPDEKTLSDRKAGKKSEKQDARDTSPDKQTKFDISGKVKAERKIISGTWQKMCRYISRLCDKSAVIAFVKSAVSSLLYLPMRAYGIAACSFGMYTLIVSLIRHFIIDRSYDLSPEYLVTGIVLVTASMPMLISTSTLANALVTSRSMNFLIFKVLGVRRESIDPYAPAKRQNNFPFIVGMVLGLLTYFASPIYISIGFAGVVMAYLLLCIPECGVVLVFLALPFLPTMAIAALNVYTAVCYLLKLVRGKRTLKLERIDAMIIVYMIFIFFGGVVSVTSASLKPALLYLSFLVGYFVVVNIIRTGEWVMRCVVSLIFSAAAVGLLGLVENFTGIASTIWQDEDMFNDISGRVVSTFGNPNVLGEYLIMTLPFAFALLFLSKRHITRLGSLILCSIGAGCLVYTWSRGAWLGFMIAAVVFMLIYTKKTLLLVFAGVFALPFMPMVLPQSILSRITSIGNIADSSTSYRVNIWKASVRMIKDFFVSGIGVGSDAFSLVYQKYTFSGIESAPHTHNLYFQIMLETGIFGFAAFAVIIVMFIQSCFAYFGSSFAEVQNEADVAGGFTRAQKMSNRMRLRSRVLVAAGLSAVIAMLAQGLTDYVWYNYRVFFMFWLVIALTQAARRSAVAETVVPDTGISTELHY